MADYLEHSERHRNHRQPRSATGVNAGPPSSCDGADDAPDEAKGLSTPAPVAVYPLTPADPHAHAWADLAELDGRARGYLASYCRLCGETQID